MSIDTLWVLICACVVVAMQAGFTCLESGLVRAKNNINVAIKNLIDFCISVIVFALFAFGLSFGTSAGGLVGTDGFLLGSQLDPDTLVFFFFQAVFCGTATTIVSGAVAERMRFIGYAATAFLLSGLIYPLGAHWAWARTADGDPAGWLARLGFHDFAGSTVVHAVGGSVALAAILVLGPRLGRFGPKSRRIDGHSLALATLRVVLLWFGWFGFNGGSTLALNEQVPGIIINTLLAGAAGGVVTMFASHRFERRLDVGHTMNGVLGGLVAVTAGCDLVSPASSLVIGSVGGLVSLAGTKLLERLKVDDAIGAVPVHLFAGIWGTLAVAVFAPPDAFPPDTTRVAQFGIQLLGVGTICVYAFASSWGLLLLANRVASLRVTPRQEAIGLNISEHGASTSLLDLVSQMDVQATSGDFSRPVRVDDETDASDIAAFYNSVLEKFNLETDRRRMAMARLSQLADLDTLTGLANRRLFFDSLRRAMSRANPGNPGVVMYLDLDGFKRVNDLLGHDAGDRLLREVGIRLARCARQKDIVGRLGGDEFAIVVEGLSDPRAEAIDLAERLLSSAGEAVIIDGNPVQVGMSIGIEIFGTDPVATVRTVVRNADHAMYLAKLSGKGAWRFHGDEEVQARVEASD